MEKEVLVYTAATCNHRLIYLALFISNCLVSAWRALPFNQGFEHP